MKSNFGPDDVKLIGAACDDAWECFERRCCHRPKTMKRRPQ
jgi:hypothetical protein